MAEPTSSGRTGLRGLFLRAAREILDEPDTPLDLRKVAEKAGKSRTAPYLAFGKTEEGGGLSALRLAVAAAGLTELADEMEEALRSSPDPEQGLRSLAHAYLVFAKEHPRLFRLAFGREVARDQAQRSAPEGPGARERRNLEEARERVEGAILSAIERQAPGFLREERTAGPRTLSGAVWAMLHGVAMLTIDEQWRLARMSESDRPEELASRALDFLTHASSQALQKTLSALREAPSQKPVSPPWSGLQLQAPASPVLPEVAVASREEAGSYGGTRAGDPWESALRRARRMLDLTRGARLLWIDDQPELIRPVGRVLEGLGMAVEYVRTTREAVGRLGSEPFDVIVSDIAREGEMDAGVRALPELSSRAPGPSPPIVFFVAHVDEGRPPPPGSFGITNASEELLHLVFDALERRRV